MAAMSLFALSLNSISPFPFPSVQSRCGRCLLAGCLIYLAHCPIWKANTIRAGNDPCWVVWCHGIVGQQGRPTPSLKLQLRGTREARESLEIYTTCRECGCMWHPFVPWPAEGTARKAEGPEKEWTGGRGGGEGEELEGGKQAFFLILDAGTSNEAG